MTLSSGASSSEEKTKKCTLMSLKLEGTCACCQGPSVGDRIQHHFQAPWSAYHDSRGRAGLLYKLFLKRNRTQQGVPWGRIAGNCPVFAELKKNPKKGGPCYSTTFAGSPECHRSLHWPQDRARTSAEAQHRRRTQDSSR